MPALSSWGGGWRYHLQTVRLLIIHRNTGDPRDHSGRNSVREIRIHGTKCVIADSRGIDEHWRTKMNEGKRSASEKLVDEPALYKLAYNTDNKIQQLEQGVEWQEINDYPLSGLYLKPSSFLLRVRLWVILSTVEESLNQCFVDEDHLVLSLDHPRSLLPQ